MTTETKFFIPKAKDDAQAQEVWKCVKKFAEETLDWEVSDRRIFSIAYQKHGKDYYVEVGKPDPRNEELVVAILESMTYLVCTPNRGVLRRYAVLDSGIRINRYYRFLTELEKLRIVKWTVIPQLSGGQYILTSIYIIKRVTNNWNQNGKLQRYVGKTC